MKMKDKHIRIPAKKVMPNEQGVIKISPESHRALTEIVDESGLSVRQVASMIILQAVEKELIVFEREEGEE